MCDGRSLPEGGWSGRASRKQRHQVSRRSKEELATGRQARETVSAKGPHARRGKFKELRGQGEGGRVQEESDARGSQGNRPRLRTQGPAPAPGRRRRQGGLKLGGRSRKMQSRVPLCRGQRGPRDEASPCSASSGPLENGDQGSMCIREVAEVPLEQAPPENSHESRASTRSAAPALRTAPGTQ